jgi:hypothetical protein
MTTANHLASLDDGPDLRPAPLIGSPCRCMAEFFREELQKHRQCLERQREYYSEVAITQAEEALVRIMEQVDYLCQREDACQVIAHLLRKFDVVTKLSAWTDSDRLQ